jgi:DNA sulfur modification protein DndB
MEIANELYIPALRGLFGDWVYYSCLIPAEEVAKRVNYAEEVHKSEKLSDLIQREIKENRGRDIAKYLKTQKDRFFNSLVVAVYRGDPTWYEVAITKANNNIPIDEIPQDALDSFGLLHLTGKERLFALDGQHRLAGLKKVKEDGHGLDDELSVILVAHKDTQAGLLRTRSLFTTLNKTAISVSKGERISLDENDAMAVVTRYLVEEHPYFLEDRVVYNATNNLTVKDQASLTTLGNLYDILSILFIKILKKGKRKELEYSRPPDEELKHYYREASIFFTQLNECFPELRQYWDAEDYLSVAKKYRGDFGGSLVFRPIGLKLIAECVAEMSTKWNIDERIANLAKLPRNLAKKPYAGILWDVSEKKMITSKQVLARRLMLYMVGEKVEKSALLADYAAALGKDERSVKLPKPLFNP